MQIIITANLTDEQALILAKEKWYSTIINIVDTSSNTATMIEVPNTETPFDFLKRVYESLIIQDAQKYFIEVFEKNRRTEQEIELNAIKEQVVLSITSSVI